jgi:putative ABC transport system permease protein
MVLYQTLATQIARHLPEFATLKAIGYGDASLAAVVAIESAVIVVAAFLPAALAASAIYALIRSETLLPLAFTAANAGLVFAAVTVMAIGSALLALSVLRRADPAEIF